MQTKSVPVRCLLAAVAILLVVRPAGAAVNPTAPPPWPPARYNINAPVCPVAYTEARKQAQRDAGRALVKQINAATAAGAHQFTAPPGVYRISTDSPDGKINLYQLRGFTLNLAHTEFIIEKGDGFLAPWDSNDISVLGPVIVDNDPLQFTQGTILTHDEATGVMTVRIMPGYRMDVPEKGCIDTFTPQGRYLENPSWAQYTQGKQADAAGRILYVKSNPEFKGLYQPGNLIAIRIGGSGVFSTHNVHNLTIRDMRIYTGMGFMWGGGDGDWNYIGVHADPRPGTNRLYSAAGCQTGNTGGNVTFDDCSLGMCADDAVDYGGGGVFMCVRRESPRLLIAWGDNLAAGNRVNVYTAAGFQPIASAIVVSVEEVKAPALQQEAHRLAKTVLKARDEGDRPMHRITLDRDVAAGPADFMENASRRIDHFTMRNCLFHDAGVRVMVQGFKHGLFENNRFSQVSGGLCLTCDAWWWEGPTCQDITVRNNVFENTAFRNGWGTGRAALVIGPAWAEGNTDPKLGCAFHGAAVTGNTFIGSSTGAVFVTNTDHVLVSNNTIRNPYSLAAPVGAVQLQGVQDALVLNNRVFGCPSPAVAATGSARIRIEGNTFRNAVKSRAVPHEETPDAVISLVNCSDAAVVGNKILGTTAKDPILSRGGTGIIIKDNVFKR